MHFAKSSAAGKRTRPRTPRSPAQGGGGTRTFPCGRQGTAACCTAAGGVTGLRGHSRAGGKGTAAPTVGGDHGQPFYIFYILYAVKFISRREASQSCQSCLKFLLHVLLISTANIDRLSSLQFYNSTRPKTVRPLVYLVYIFYMVNTVRVARDCDPYHWTAHGPHPHSTSSTFSTRLIPIPHLCVLRVFA